MVHKLSDTETDRLVCHLRELGSHDCVEGFDAHDHHMLFVAAAQIERLSEENKKQVECIRSLIEEPSKSVKLISNKWKFTEPMTATFLKGQVLDAMRLSK